MGYRTLAERIDKIESEGNPQLFTDETLCILRALEDIAEELYMLRIHDNKP